MTTEPTREQVIKAWRDYADGWQNRHDAITMGALLPNLPPVPIKPPWPIDYLLEDRRYDRHIFDPAKGFWIENAPMHSSAQTRTGSNPLYDLARKYGVSLQSVYCFAEMHRRRVFYRLHLERQGYEGPLTFWDKQSLKMTLENCKPHDDMALLRAIRSQVVDFMITQQWINPNDPRIESLR